MGWLEDVQGCVEALPARFDLRDLEVFTPFLHRRHPANYHIEAKVRQQLQRLRDAGEIRFLGDGAYEKVRPPSRWLPKVGSHTNREELAEILGQDGPAALRRGMFKPARGPFRKHIFLFHSAADNPYGDDVSGDDRIIYVGQGQKGDQKLDSYNRYLAQHLEEGFQVHFFHKERRHSAELEYRGQVVVESVERTYREAEGRSVLEFTLVPARDFSIATEYGAAFQDMLTEDLEPRVINRPTTLHLTKRRLRDRAFASILREMYRNECAVCGPPLISGDLFDLQGAHVRAVAAGGPDVRNNGICLCSRHHWAFDAGVFALSDRKKIMVRDGWVDPHGELASEQEIALPWDELVHPHPSYLAWHRQTWRFT